MITIARGAGRGLRIAEIYTVSTFFPATSTTTNAVQIQRQARQLNDILNFLAN